MVQDDKPPPDLPDGHASHGEWYDMYYKEEMKEIEELHRSKAGIKTKLTVKKRKSGEAQQQPTKKVMFCLSYCI